MPEDPHASLPSLDPSIQSRSLEEVDASDNLYQQVLAGRSSLDKIHDPEKRAIVELTQAALEQVAIGIHDLHKLPHDEQVEALDSIVEVVFDQDEQAQNNIRLIQAARAERREEEAKIIITEQKKNYESLRLELAFMLGVEVQDTEKENERYRNILMEKVAEMKGQPDEEIMKALGFLVADPETGKTKFNFPREAFPPHIIEKWDTYATLVREHTRASQKFNRAIEDNSEEIVQLDMLRRYAHNNLAQSVQGFLQLDSWDFDRCRKFITKMIEERYPTVETSESTVTSQAVLNRLRAVQALGHVVQHNT